MFSPASVCCQSKHQKHQAFEAELHANADRIRGVIDTGNALIQRGACAGSEDAVKVCLSWLHTVTAVDPNTHILKYPLNISIQQKLLANVGLTSEWDLQVLKKVIK